MKRTLLIILLILASSVNIRAQYSHLADYFPLAVGNKWIYGHQTKLPPSFSIHVYEITKDTVIDDFKYYYHKMNTFYDSWMRFDTLTGNLLVRAVGMGCGSHPNDYVLDSLNARPNDEIYCSRPPAWPHRCLTSSDSVKEFYEDDIVARYRDYKLGIGITTYTYAEGNSEYYNLRGYVINGIVHGDTALTGIKQISAEVPQSFYLFQNYPNPFNPSTKIRFSIASTQQISLTIYDMNGKEISKLVNEVLPAGEYETEFNSNGLSSGIYYYKFSTSDFIDVKKMVLIK